MVHGGMSYYLHGCMTVRTLVILPCLLNACGCAVVGLPIQYVLFAVLLLVVGIVGWWCLAVRIPCWLLVGVVSNVFAMQYIAFAYCSLRRCMHSYLFWCLQFTHLP